MCITMTTMCFTCPTALRYATPNAILSTNPLIPSPLEKSRFQRQGTNLRRITGNRDRHGIVDKVNDVRYSVSKSEYNFDHYVHKDCAIKNVHYFTHFNKPKNNESTESYRKNVSPFLTTNLQPNDLKFSKAQVVANKIGSRNPKNRLKERTIPLIDYSAKMKATKTLDGKQIKIQKLKEYLKDLELFSKNRATHHTDKYFFKQLVVLCEGRRRGMARRVIGTANCQATGLCAQRLELI
eukprot:TRINITY_DN6491_c0_g3_i5.p1 TRINITY_DN6491_c0_g3~~TRINITY_DN6491_c0_g3_i5.p1  ORF type:complete len:238 (-),score=4.86 TRINITY_DN6491_c0_g3_i5:340-1053(-)